MQTEKNKYEISFLAPTEEGAGIVLKHLNQVDAEINDEQQLEQISLAYPIKKHNSAYLGCIHFTLDPEEVTVLRDTLKFEENILRYTIVTPPFIKVEETQPRGPRTTQESVIERAPSAPETVSNKDLEARLEEITGSLEKEV